MVDWKVQASGLGVGGGHTPCRGQETCQQPKLPRITREWLWFWCLVLGSLEFSSPLQCHFSPEKGSLRVERARPGQDQA